MLPLQAGRYQLSHPSPGHTVLHSLRLQWSCQFQGISRDTVPLKIVRGDNVSLKNRRRRQQITAAAPEPPEPIDEEETVLEDMPSILEDSLPSLEDTPPSVDDPTTEDGTKRFG